MRDYQIGGITDDMINTFRNDQHKSKTEKGIPVNDNSKISSRKPERKRKPKKHGGEDHVIPEKKAKASDELKKKLLDKKWKLRRLLKTKKSGYPQQFKNWFNGNFFPLIFVCIHDEHL